MELIPSRFLDLWLVQLVVAIPLARQLSRTISPRLRPLLTIVCVAISLSSWSFSGAGRDLLSAHILWLCALQQLLFTVPFILGLTLFAQPFFHSAREQTPQSVSETNRSRWLWVSVLLLAVLPAGVYRMSRIQSAAAQLEQYQSQMRVGEFVALGEDVLKIAPAATYQTQPLAQVLQLWEDKYRELSNVLPHITENEQKARLLAVLGRRSEALDLLELDSPRNDQPPARCLLTATIFEHEQDWTQSQFWYEQARQQLEDTDAESLLMLAAAYRGIGFCCRKQGENPQAEAAYQKLLELEPTAQTHFLLAQFYQDAQAGEESAHHLDRAVQLDEEQYRETAAEMKRRLQSHQFSCFRLSP